MKWATTYTSIPLDLKEINRVRISHGLCSISEICEANGKRRNKNYNKSKKVNSNNNSYKCFVKHHVKKMTIPYGRNS